MVVLSTTTYEEEIDFTHFVYGRDSYLGTARDDIGRIKLFLFKQDRVFTKNGANDTWNELNRLDSERIRTIANRAAKSGRCPEFTTSNLETILN